jgi:glutaminyl-tRNA synthetase
VLILDDAQTEETAETSEEESDEAVPAGAEFLKQVNPDSLKVVCGYGEPWLANAKVGDSFQFMRTAYFCKDKDSTDALPVFNRTVALKDSWAKEAKK